MKNHIGVEHKVASSSSKRHDNNEHVNASSTDTESDKNVYKCNKCNFKTVNKKKFKKHNKKPHVNISGSNSPARKKPKTESDIPAVIVDEILASIHDQGESETEPNKEMAKF